MFNDDATLRKGTGPRALMRLGAMVGAISQASCHVVGIPAPRRTPRLTILETRSP